MKALMIVLCALGIHLHDIQVAFFKIHQQDEGISIHIVLEYDALNKNLEDSTDQKIEDYIQSNFSISINNTKRPISFEKLQMKDDHVYLNGTIPKIEKTIEEIEILNTCLITQKGHSNIIELNIRNSQRDFLMNKRRTSINIQY